MHGGPGRNCARMRQFQSADVRPAIWDNRNVFIPGAGHLFVVPGMVLHNIDVHGCAPPDVFGARGANAHAARMRGDAYFRVRSLPEGAFSRVLVQITIAAHEDDPAI